MSVVGLVVSAGVLAWAVSAAANQPVSPQVALGVRVFAAQKCSICHAIAGVGNKKLPLDGVGAKLSVEQIREWIVSAAEAAKKAKSTTKPPMKSYPNLLPADLDALVLYMKSLDKR